MLDSAVQRVVDDSVDLSANAYRKITFRIVPFLCVCYLFAYLDRVNVALAKLEMARDLGMTETMYGLGAGLFFIGYALFQVPSNLILLRLGARVWIGVIAILWGSLSICTMWIHTSPQFYVVRFLLGTVEAGFLPGVVLYLTTWYPASRRAKVMGCFVVGLPVSSLLGNPLSAWIMSTFAQSHGLAGWQWLFLLEGLPSIVLGVLVFLFLPSDLRSVSWLTKEELDAVSSELSADTPVREGCQASYAFSDSNVWKLAFVNMTVAMVFYLVGFWLPTIIRETGVKGEFTNGFLSAIPSVAAIILMFYMVASSDAHGEYRRHLALSLTAAAASLICCAAYGGGTVVTLIMLTIANAFAFAAIPICLSIPGRILPYRAAAVGIAVVSAVTNLGGFLATYLIGWIRDLTHGIGLGLIIFAVLSLIAAFVALRIRAPGETPEVLGSGEPVQGAKE
ncbi:MFS transporter [Burkholderia sp. S171]|uniref:MFS transporter n=1 Tax=Burkholderia sp. S171 TaxID=1641860 RepID=UPI00131CCFAB|nr:MFS transporter [Burkholderia sp. S171]